MNRSERRKAAKNANRPNLAAKHVREIKVTNSLLDVMKDGREFESTLGYAAVDFDLIAEIRRSLDEISAARGRPVVCYAANVVAQDIKVSTSIDSSDDLPFNELVSCAPSTDDLDVILVTGGGSGQQVAKFVERLRAKYKNVSFILPSIAMSAGTILVMSGDEIVMTPSSYIGPIDPQIPGKNGSWVPAQSILSLIEDIRVRGEEQLRIGKNPHWTDLQILNHIDGKEIGNALNASQYSIELVKNYLANYKFRTWDKHSSTGAPVTPQDKIQRANEIATLLCNHARWKSHSRGITREVAWEECRLKITHSENIPDLDRAVRRFWALLNWTFENTAIYKLFISKDYSLLRIDNVSPKFTGQTS